MRYSLLAYGDKMLHDKFDGSKGFAIDGGIKDATYALIISCGILMVAHHWFVHIATFVN